MLKKFKTKGAFKFLHIGPDSIEVATATDEDIAKLRDEKPDAFEMHFEEVKEKPVAAVKSEK